MGVVINMLHLSRSTVSIPQSSTPKTARLTALVTKYYSLGDSEEVQGWRRPLDLEGGDLAVQTSRPYTVRSKGQWTRQPRYPHIKPTANTAKPQFRPSQSKLPTAPLRPSVGELSLQSQAVGEAKVYLPPLRYVDNRASHHDHPAPFLDTLSVVPAKDVFQPKASKSKKSKARGRTKTITKPIEAQVVRFPRPTHYSFSETIDDSPLQEKLILVPFVKPVAVPEKRVRQCSTKHTNNSHLTKPLDKEEEVSPLDEQSESSEGSLFSYTDVAELEEPDQLATLPDQSTPFPDLQSPTLEEHRSSPADRAEITPFQDTKLTPIEDNLPTLEDKYACLKDPLPVLFDPSNDVTARGVKWNSVSTMENSLGQVLFPEDRPTEGTHERVNTMGTETSIVSFDASSCEVPANIQVLESITITSEGDQEEEELPVPRVQERAEKRGSVQLPQPEAFPTLKRAVSLELPAISSRLAAPSTVLTATQLADLDPRMQRGKKKPPPLADIETRPSPQARKPPKETKKPTKKSKTSLKSASKADVFDFKREVSKPLDLPTATFIQSESSKEEENYAVIQEQAGEESEEEGWNTSKPSIEAPLEELKKAASLEVLQVRHRRSSVNVEMLRRGSSQVDPSLEDESLNKSATLAEEELKSNEDSRKGKRQTGKPMLAPRQPTLKKTSETTKNGPLQSPPKLVKSQSTEPSLSVTILKHSAQSSLSSSEESGSEQDESGPEAGKSKGSDGLIESKKRRKRTGKAKEGKIVRKRSSIVASNRSDPVTEQTSPLLSRQPADEVFVRHFALNMLAFMHSMASKRSLAVSRGLDQLAKVRKEVLSLEYGLSGATKRRASIFPRRRTSKADAKRPKRLRRSITTSFAALSGLKEHLEESLNPSDEEYASDDSVSSTDLHLTKFSRAEFEIKHLSMLKSLALKLLNLNQPSELEQAYIEPQLTAGELWERTYQDQHQTVSHSLENIFKDYKSTAITAFTSVVTSFFRDPQAIRNADLDNEELEKVELDVANYKEELERRKFKEYSRQWTAYEVQRLSQPQEMRQLTDERLHPQELSSYFHNMLLKRKRRRVMIEVRNGTLPAVLKAKPRTTETGLLLEYYQQQVGAAGKGHVPRDVVLSGGAHLVQSEEEYRERVYCRLKHEKDLQKFSHKHG